MPETVHQVDVDDELGFKTKHTSSLVDIEIERSSSETQVHVEHGCEVWTLTFSEAGKLKHREPEPPTTPPMWLGPAIKKAAPRLKVA